MKVWCPPAPPSGLQPLVPWQLSLWLENTAAFPWALKCSLSAAMNFLPFRRDQMFQRRNLSCSSVVWRHGAGVHRAVHVIDCIGCQRFFSWCQERKCFDFTNKRILSRTRHVKTSCGTAVFFFFKYIWRFTHGGGRRWLRGCYALSLNVTWAHNLTWSLLSWVFLTHISR